MYSKITILALIGALANAQDSNDIIVEDEVEVLTGGLDPMPEELLIEETEELVAEIEETEELLTAEIEELEELLALEIEDLVDEAEVDVVIPTTSGSTSDDILFVEEVVETSSTITGTVTDVSEVYVADDNVRPTPIFTPNEYWVTEFPTSEDDITISYATTMDQHVDIDAFKMYADSRDAYRASADQARYSHFDRAAGYTRSNYLSTQNNADIGAFIAILNFGIGQTKQFIGNDAVDQDALASYRFLAIEIRDSLITLDEANDVYGADMYEKSRFGSANTLGEEIEMLNIFWATMEASAQSNDSEWGWAFYNPDTTWTQGANNVWSN